MSPLWAQRGGVVRQSWHVRTRARAYTRMHTHTPMCASCVRHARALHACRYVPMWVCIRVRACTQRCSIATRVCTRIRTLADMHACARMHERTPATARSIRDKCTHTTVHNIAVTEPALGRRSHAVRRTGVFPQHAHRLPHARLRDHRARSCRAGVCVCVCVCVCECVCERECVSVFLQQ